MSEESKSKVTAIAKSFFMEAVKQAPALLAHRLGIDSEQYSPALGKAAAFWFAAQKLYLSAQDLKESPEELFDLKTHKQDYLFGVLDLLRRCEQTVDLAELPPAHQHKLHALARRTQNELAAIESAMNQQNAEALLEHPEDVEASFNRFLQAREVMLASKLQYLPDTKLIKILGFDTGTNFTLEEPYRNALQRFVHLQTLFESVKAMPDSDPGRSAFKILCVELQELGQLEGAQDYLADGYFIQVHLLLLRVVEWGEAHGLGAMLGERRSEFKIKALPIRALINTCFKMGFAALSSKGKLAITLGTRAFFIGQGLLLLTEHKLDDMFSVFNEFYASGQIDYPAIGRMTSQQRLLITMPGQIAVGQVAISHEMMMYLQSHLKLRWLEYFEVPEDRNNFKVSQVKQLQTSFTLCSDLQDANRVAQQLFLALAEMGADWPDMFAFMKGVKAMFKQKNVKVIWHEDASPYWTLRLRSEIRNPLFAEPFPKAEQVSRLLKRFEF